jgi:hypothetical protein
MGKSYPTFFEANTILNGKMKTYYIIVYKLNNYTNYKE